MGRTLFSVIGPDWSRHPSCPCPRRSASACQIRSSDQSSMSVSDGTCRYSRVTVGDRIEFSAKPSGCHA
jgi:hypothetical protein